MSKPKRYGFTLAELLVVIVIIGILVGLGGAALLSKSFENAEGAARTLDGGPFEGLIDVGDRYGDGIILGVGATPREEELPLAVNDHSAHTDADVVNTAFHHGCAPKSSRSMFRLVAINKPPRVQPWEARRSSAIHSLWGQSQPPRVPTYYTRLPGIVHLSFDAHTLAGLLK